MGLGPPENNMADSAVGAPAVHADGMEFTGSSYRGDSTNGRCVSPVLGAALPVPMHRGCALLA